MHIIFTILGIWAVVGSICAIVIAVIAFSTKPVRPMSPFDYLLADDDHLSVSPAYNRVMDVLLSLKASDDDPLLWAAHELLYDFPTDDHQLLVDVSRELNAITASLRPAYAGNIAARDQLEALVAGLTNRLSVRSSA